ARVHKEDGTVNASDPVAAQTTCQRFGRIKIIWNESRPPGDSNLLLSCWRKPIPGGCGVEGTPQWRFRGTPHSRHESEMRTSEPSPHLLNRLLASVDSEVRKRGCRRMMRTPEHTSAGPLGTNQPPWCKARLWTFFQPIFQVLMRKSPIVLVGLPKGGRIHLADP